MIVVGLDMSLTRSGIARIADGGPIGSRPTPTLRWNTDRPVCTGCLETTAAGARIPERARRVRAAAGYLFNACEGADLVVVEEPTYTSGGSAHDRSGLWWLVVARLDAQGFPVVQVNPNTLKVYALGKGSGKGVSKDAVLASVVRRYEDHAPELADNNEADALVLADMGARHLGRPLVQLPQTHTRAMAAVHWPNPTGEA